MKRIIAINLIIFTLFAAWFGTVLFLYDGEHTAFSFRQKKSHVTNRMFEKYELEDKQDVQTSFKPVIRNDS
ncbi:hypothetical protein BVY03_02125 [bacterium K02(2017)]|nr:hypothetical protein BVY03_02125 [bacterium K02(2017)]